MVAMCRGLRPCVVMCDFVSSPGKGKDEPLSYIHTEGDTSEMECTHSDCRLTKYGVDTYVSTPFDAAVLLKNCHTNKPPQLLGACPRKKSLKDNILEPRRGDFKISHFLETRILTGDRNFLEFSENP